MTPNEMLQLFTQPEMLRQVSISDLRRTVEAYPCFAMARMLYVKALKEQGDMDYPQELFKASLQAPSRRQLFYFIQGRKSLQNTAEAEYADTCLPPLPSAVTEREGGSVSAETGFSLIDRFLDEQKQDESRDIPLSQVTAYDIEGALGDGSDVEEDNEIIRRFMESGAEPLPRSDTDASPVVPITDSPVMPEAAFTLTLARIYLKQKKYDQALEIFRSLVLKNPEKSIYFAAQIRYLEKVINHLNQ